MNPNTTVKPRITFCITELDVGGAEKALVRIAIGLQANDWNVRVISLRDEGPLAEELRSAGIPVTGLRCGTFADVRTFFRLRSELSGHPADLLMCFLHQANIYGRLAARFAGRPIVVSGIRVADRRKWVTLTDRFTRCCTDQYIAVSQHVADTHADLCKIAADRICAIPNGVDLPDRNESPPEEIRADNVLLSVGRLAHQKDPLCLLEAFAQLPDDLQSNVTLKFVGEGPLQKQIADRIRELGLEENVQLLGQSERVPELMRQATLLVLPSRYEGMPNVVLEAMANGLPVVAADVDGVRELVEHGQTGWLVPPGDPVALTASLQLALGDPKSRSDIADSAQAVVGESFTWESVVNEYDRKLTSLVAAKR